MKNGARYLRLLLHISFAFFISGVMICLTFAQITQVQEKTSFSDAILQNLRWRLLGPAYFGGRVSNIAVPRGIKYTIYCAAASGGIWKTTNNGTTWDPIFDDHGTGSIGCISIAPKDSNTIWVGTGEAIAASYSTWGDGVYKSTDAGKTWSHMGLKDSYQVGRIVIDPEDPNIVYVAAVGRLWGPHPERGLFKSTDGGKTWTKSLYVSDRVGVVSVEIDPSDNKTLYAAAYGRMKRPELRGAKILEGGGIYKTTDAGKTWIQLKEGLPSARVGKIGLAVSQTNPNKIYAIVERGPLEITLSQEEFQKIKDLIPSDKELDPKEAKRIRELIEKLTPAEERQAVVVDGLSNEEQIKLRRAIGLGELDAGGGVFRSTNKGVSWARMSKSPVGRSYYSKIYVHPLNEDEIYVPEVRMWISSDGGASFKRAGWAFSSWMTSSYIHGDFHPFWINPEDPNHLIIGSDGGLYSSYDKGQHWEAHHLPIGQFYTVTVDMRNPYYVYGGTQDNGGWGGPSASRHMSGVFDHDWFKYETADGGYVQVDPTDNMTIYTELQNGAISRICLRTGTYKGIRPRATKGESPLRFGFIAPFTLSIHNHRTIYMGAQRVLRTRDGGDNWTSISPDLTKGKFEEATITTLSESPLVPGLLFVGTVDGNLYVTKDDGNTWTNVIDSIPHLPRQEKRETHIHVSRVEPSHFDPGTAYVSFDGHRDDDYQVYLFRTSDYGKSWTSIKGDLPDGFPVRVVREDFKNPNLLFVGTSVGVYASIDGGIHWEALKNGLPRVPVADMMIHPREADLVIGTFGRGIYVMDISFLEELTPQITNADIHLFDVKPATLYYLDITKNKGNRGARRFYVPNPFHEVFDLEASRFILGKGSELAPPGANIYYYIQKQMSEPVEITVLDFRGETVLRNLTGESRPGVNRVVWDLRGNPLPPPPGEIGVGGHDEGHLRERGKIETPGPLVQPGQYIVRLTAGGKTIERKMLVNSDKYLQF